MKKNTEKKVKGDESNGSTENEIKKIHDLSEQEGLIFKADALLPQPSIDKELEIHYLQNGKAFTIKGQRELINSFANKECDPMFPNKIGFFKVMYKLNKWDHLDPEDFIKPPIVAVWIKQYIYGRFSPDVLPTLLEMDNPLIHGYIKKYKLYQFFNEEGLVMMEGVIHDMIRDMEESLSLGESWF